MEYKTFEDLQFRPHYILEEGKHAKIKFENGYGVSVVFGDVFYSNGIDTYEVAIMDRESIARDKKGDQMIFGRVSKERVTEIMKMVQGFKTKD